MPKVIDSFRLGANTMARAELSGGDFIASRRFSNGQQPVILSVDPLTESTESVIYPMVNTTAIDFYAFEVELALNQRPRHLLPYLDVSSMVSRKSIPYPISIVSIFQSSAGYGVAYNATAGITLQIQLSAPAPDDLVLGDWVHISGLTDNRLNYPNLNVAYISLDRMTIGGAVTDEVALPSLALTYTPPAGTAFVNFYSDFSGSTDAAGIRFSGTVPTSSAFLTSYNGGIQKIIGSPTGAQTATLASSALVTFSGQSGNIDVEPTSRYRVECREDSVGILAKTSNSPSNYWIPYGVRNSLRPNRNLVMTPRVRAVCPPSMTRPVAKILTATKTGTTTTTVTHDGSYPFQTGQYVTIKGIRDTVNFASITTPAVITVVDQFNFTIVLGTAVTATSHGGTVCLTNGGADQPGINVVAVQSVTWDSVNQVLVLVGNTTWFGLLVSEYVNIHGLRSDVDGSDLGVDGVWEVWHTNTTSLYLKPVVDIRGNLISPAINTLALTNCGGSVILRTNIRVVDFYCEEIRKDLSIDGQGTARVDRALPVRLVAQDPVPLMRGYVAADAVADTQVVAMGGKVANSNPTAMSASGDANHALMTMIGALVMRPYSIPESEWSYTGSVTVTTDIAVKAAAAAGIRNYVNGLQLQNTGAAATTFLIKDGTTVIWQCSLPASMATPVDIEFKIPLKGTAATAVNVACGTASTVLVNVQGHFAP